MKTRSFLLPLLAVLLFLVGVLSQLALSVSVVWGEIEASIYGTQAASPGLRLECPRMLSPSETGVIRTTITNSINQDVLPVVTAEISHGGNMKSLSQTLSLAPHESRDLQWQVDHSNITFRNLILVNITQARYSGLEPRRGFCGILIFSLFNLSGNESFSLIIITGLALIGIGGFLWWRTYTPLNESNEQTLRACTSLAGVTTLALLSTLPRWWGLTLFLDVFALIMMGVIFTEFQLIPKQGRN